MVFFDFQGLEEEEEVSQGSRGAGEDFLHFFEGGKFYLCSLLVAHAYSNAHMGGRPPLGLNRGALLPLSERPLLRMSGKPLLQVSGRPLLHMSGKPLLQVARVFFVRQFPSTVCPQHSETDPQRARTSSEQTTRGRFNAFAPPLQNKTPRGDF